MSALPVEKRMQRMGRPRLGANMPTQFDTGKPSKEELQRRERGASMQMPDESAYNRAVAPQAQPRQAQPGQQPPTPQVQPTQQTRPGYQSRTQSAQVKSLILSKINSKQTPKQIRGELESTYRNKIQQGDPNAEYFNPANYPEIQ